MAASSVQTYTICSPETCFGVTTAPSLANIENRAWAEASSSFLDCPFFLQFSDSRLPRRRIMLGSQQRIRALQAASGLVGEIVRGNEVERLHTIRRQNHLQDHLVALDIRLEQKRRDLTFDRILSVQLELILGLGKKSSKSVACLGSMRQLKKS